MQFTVLVGNPRGVIQQHTGGGDLVADALGDGCPVFGGEWGVGGVGFGLGFVEGFGAMGGVGVSGWASLKGASFVFRLPETVAACASLAWVATVFRLPTGEAGVAGVVSAFAVMRSLAGAE